MAYDLDNEPHYKDGDHGYYSRPKNEVCRFTETLYNAIKPNADPNHLITIGLGDEGTLETWDPEVIKADFVSLHLYPYFTMTKYFGIHSAAIENSKDRLLAKIYWASKFVQRPWVLQETGFTSVEANFSENYWNWYGVSGNYTQLENFISELLTAVKDCGVSGIAWWNFQDSFNSSGGPALPNPTDPTSTESKKFREECWGILKRGDPVAGDYSSCEKMNVSPFVGYDQVPPQTVCSVEPPELYDELYTYYDPFHNYLDNANTSTYVSGTVTDNNTNTVEGAVIIGDCWLFTSYSGLDPVFHTYPITTFSDIGGNYKLIPYNFHANNLNDNRIIKVSVRSFGTTNSSFSSWTDDPVGSVISFDNLEKSSLEYDSNIEINPPITSVLSEPLSAWNSISISGDIYGSCDIIARNTINLSDGFNAFDLSEVHVFTSEVFNGCVDFSGYRKAQNSASENLNDNEKNILLSFIETNKKFKLNIFPNPNSGKFNVSLINAKSGIVTSLIIRDISGSQIFQTKTNQTFLELNLTNISNGVYFVEGVNQDEVYVTKLIIQ